MARKCVFLGWETGRGKLLVNRADPDTTGHTLGSQSGEAPDGSLGGGGKIRTASP